jgi:hypothetical protein
LRNLSIRQQLMLPVTGNNAEFFLRPYGQQLGNTGFRQGFISIDRRVTSLLPNREKAIRSSINGTVRIDSKPGKGCAVTIVIPLQAQAGITG